MGVCTTTRHSLLVSKVRAIFMTWKAWLYDLCFQKIWLYMTKQKYFFFQYLSGASLLLHAIQQKSASGAIAHLTIEFLIRCTCELLKIFSNRFDRCSTGKFTFGIVTSVSNLAKWQLTHSSVKRESKVDPKVERNLSCHKMLYAASALASAGPNVRPRRGAHLSSGVLTPSWSVNRAMTFFMVMI